MRVDAINAVTRGHRLGWRNRIEQR